MPDPYNTASKRTCAIRLSAPVRAKCLVRMGGASGAALFYVKNSRRPGRLAYFPRPRRALHPTTRAADAAAQRFRRSHVRPRAPSDNSVGPSKSRRQRAGARPIVWIGLRAYRNPLAALATLRRLRASYLQDWTTPTRVARLWTSQKCVAVSGRVFFDLSLPGWPSSAFDRAIEDELERLTPTGRRPALQTAVVAITKRCGLRCEHCFEWDVINQPETLSTDDLRAIVAQIQRRGAAQLFLSGGEPLSRFDDVLVVTRMAAASMDVWVLTRPAQG